MRSPRHTDRPGQPPSKSLAGWRKTLGIVPIALFSLLCAVILPVSQTFAADYLVGPQDTLKVRVFEWRPTTGSAFEWVPLNGEFVVSAAGNISLPIIGTLPASGKTVEQVSLSISETLQTQVGLQRRPNASVEVATYRPFFITGMVATPGKYSFSPGLTVVQAVSMAGGFGPIAPSLIGLQRDALISRGDISALAEERLRLLARQARVDAALKDDTAIDFPPELTNRSQSPAVARLMQEERSLFAARRVSMMTEIDALNRAKDLAAKQIDTLNSKAVSLTRQTDLANRELKNVNRMISKGLTVSAREFGANQSVAELEGRSLDVSLAILKTQTDLAKIDQDISDVHNRYQVDALTEAAELRDKMSTNVARAKTAQSLINNLQARAPAALMTMGGDEEQTYVTTIDRLENGEMTTQIVRDNDLVAPGDVLRVGKPASTPIDN